MGHVLVKEKKYCQLNPDTLLTLRCLLISEILKQEKSVKKLESKKCKLFSGQHNRVPAIFDVSLHHSPITA